MSGVSGVGSSGNIPPNSEQPVQSDPDTEQALDYLSSGYATELSGVGSEAPLMKEKG